jgi:hypothetical protein
LVALVAAGCYGDEWTSPSRAAQSTPR